MGNIDLSILRLSDTIEQSINDTLGIYQRILASYKNGLPDSPLEIDLLDDALSQQNLRETAHSRILYRILQDKNMQIKFVKHFLPDVSCSYSSIIIPYPDRHRIDLTIKSDTFFLIIENKINNAREQGNQIKRYVNIAQRTYPDEQIYVMYLGGEHTIRPSEKSMPANIRQMLCDRAIFMNYKDDITPWIASVYEETDFNRDPYLKSSLLLYKTYLENMYNLNEMKNKLKKTLIETLGLESMSLDEKIEAIDDQMNNLDTIKNSLYSIFEECCKQRNIIDIKEWYRQCSDILPKNITLTMEDDVEFGFNFTYRNLNFRCSVSYDTDVSNEDPGWGICGLTEERYSCPEIFESLKRMILDSNKGFHDLENNPPEWVVSNYEKKDLIVDRFVELANLIQSSDFCYIA